VWGVGVTADDVRGCYDPVLPHFRGCYDPVLPRFSCLFVEIKFELTVAFCRNNKFRSSRIRNNPPLSLNCQARMRERTGISQVVSIEVQAALTIRGFVIYGFD